MPYTQKINYLLQKENRSLQEYNVATSFELPGENEEVKVSARTIYV